MGLAALVVLVILGVAVVVAMLYGAFLGLGKLSHFFWRLVEPEARPAGARPCWEARNCSQELRSRCPAYGRVDVPCWLANMRSLGKLKPECLTCQQFSLAGMVGGASSR